MANDPLQLCIDYQKFCETICEIDSLAAALPDDALRIAVAALLMDELVPVGRSIMAIGSFGDVGVERCAQILIDAGFTQSLVNQKLRSAEELFEAIRRRIAEKVSL
jgi:hypothetical protein